MRVTTRITLLVQCSTFKNEFFDSKHSVKIMIRFTWSKKASLFSESYIRAGRSGEVMVCDLGIVSRSANRRRGFGASGLSRRSAIGFGRSCETETLPSDGDLRDYLRATNGQEQRPQHADTDTVCFCHVLLSSSLPITKALLCSVQFGEKHHSGFDPMLWRSGSPCWDALLGFGFAQSLLIFRPQ